MYYIKSSPSPRGNYGTPVSRAFPGALALPEDLLKAYTEAKGFVIPVFETITRRVTVDVYDEETGEPVGAEETETTAATRNITGLEVNREALDAYLEEHPGADAESEPSEDDIALDLLADHEYRLCMLELGMEV